MTEKRLNTRIVHKHAVEADWVKATGFTPMNAELIVYDPDDVYDYPRIKIGDGVTNVNSLPFMTEVDSTALNAMLEEVLV